jgi:ABC-type multidrug transport system fused ATPase/permease subunit
VFLEHLRITKLLANQKAGKRMREIQKSAENEIIKGLKQIKGLDAKAAVLEKHSVINRQAAAIKRNREIFDKGMNKTIDVVKTALDFALLVIAGLYLIPKGQIELLAVLVIYNYRGNVYELISGIARIRDYFVNGELAAKRLNDVMLAPASQTDGFGDRALDKPIEIIEFKDVKFEYTPGKPVLKDIDLTLNKNSLYGFVGRSGSGKSTIFSLLTNFYQKTGGGITVNGIPLGDLSESALRHNISPVLQDPYIFNDTIYNNVLLARPDATGDEITEVCKKARLHDEILLTENGYDTMIGENGANLSGGQKQRLEIARVLLKNTDVILFDEATSALDKNNLSKINELLLELKKTKIVLVIAHRLGVMRLCDEVFVLDEGEIVAHGEHSALIASSAYYADLFKKSKPETETAG